MKAIVFFNGFQNIFVKYTMMAESAYADNKGFTTFITRKINEMLVGGAQKKQNEYFRIDAIQWTPKANLIEKHEDIHLKDHLWDLEIAVEHENDPRDWMDEVVKLAHVVCPLRVVIGYMPWDKRDEDLKYLDHVSRWLKELQCRDNMQRGEFLIILGNCNTDGKKEHFFGYRGYLFDPEQFCFRPISQ